MLKQNITETYHDALHRKCIIIDNLGDNAQEFYLFKIVLKCDRKNIFYFSENFSLKSASVLSMVAYFCIPPPQHTHTYMQDYVKSKKNYVHMRP